MIRSECVLKVGVIGINHKTANLPFREAMARGSASLSGEKAVFFLHPVLLLSTCNRTEIYFGGEDLAVIHSDLLEWLRGFVQGSFEHRLYSYFGIDCFFHLARVTAGLDSAILAETEIQAQVKNAYATATRFSLLPSCMHYIFQKALKIGKLVRSQMSMELAPSLFQAIWQIASGHLTDLTKARILLVGNSEINRRMAHFLRQRKIDRFTWITQHPSTSLDGCEVFGYEAIDAWPQYDWIICGSAQDRFLIHGDASLSTLRHAIFDLSVPRNVDPKVGDSKDVLLFNIEQINEWIQKAKSKNSGQIAILNGMIRKETIRLAQIYWQKTQHTRTQYAQGILGTE